MRLAGSQRIIGAAGLAAGLLLTAGGVAHAKPLSDKQWRKQASEACAELQQARLAILPPSGGAIWARKDATAARTYVTQAAPLYEALIDDVSRLKPPKRTATTAKKFVASLTEGIEGIEADPLAAFNPFDNPFQDAYDLSKKLRTKSCDGIANQRL